ncbi:MAG: hypothetical protein ABR563_04505, partial [Pyrinomonadaceae bacterium]
EQRARFRSLDTYPRSLSPRLRALRDELARRSLEDDSGWERVLRLPTELAESFEREREKDRTAVG